MTKVEMLSHLHEASNCAERAFWQIKGIGVEEAKKAGVLDLMLKALEHLHTTEATIIDIILKLTEIEK